MVMPDTDDPFLQKFFSRIEPAVAWSFSPAQIAAIRTAFGGRPWRRHAIDIRLSLPLPRRRYFLVFLAGREMRSPERRVAERAHHPLASLGNAIVTVLFAVVIAFPLLLSLFALQAAISVRGGQGPGGGTLIDQFLDQLDQLFK